MLTLNVGGFVMDLKEYYESVINELEGHLLSTDKLYKERYEHTKSFLREKKLSDSDVEFLLSAMNYFYCLGKDSKSIEFDIKRYRDNLTEAEERIEGLK